MPGENWRMEPVTEKREKIYGGQYVQVARTASGYLLACAHKWPDSNEGEYLINMINELRDVYDKITNGGELGEIYVSALVEVDYIVHTITIGKGGEVQISPLISVDRERIAKAIEWADMVEIEPAKGDYMVYRGDYVTVFEEEGGLLRAYITDGLDLKIREGLDLKPYEAMSLGVNELLREYKRITWSRKNKPIEIMGAILYKGLAYRPTIYENGQVKFRLVRGDYVDLAKAAGLILFPVTGC